MKSALVITPTTGAPELADAANSVFTQDYGNLEYLVIVDGLDFAKNTWDTLMAADFTPDDIHTLVLPFNTGGGGFYGHRIMAAASHLVKHDYILFLDQDNWISPNHVSSLVACCEDSKHDWAYSLRNVYSKDKEFICEDNCESLGKWPIASAPGNHLIDTSTYCFSLAFLKATGHLWDHGWGADRRFYSIVKDTMKHTNYDCSGLYSLNYRLGGNEGSVQPSFFEEGNKINTAAYDGNFPWRK